jgi:hypothetical protein
MLHHYSEGDRADLRGAKDFRQEEPGSHIVYYQKPATFVHTVARDHR